MQDAPLSAGELPLRDSRLISVPLKGNIIGMIAGQADDEILIATQSGYAKRINLACIPYADEMNSNGTKIMQRTNPVLAMPYQSDKALWALTTKRFIPIEQNAIPLDNDDKTEHLIFKPKRGEKLITIFTLP